MVFGLFTRKSTLDDAEASSEPTTNDQNARLPTPTPSVASVARHSPLRFSTAIRAVLGGSTTDPTLKDSDLATESIARGGNTAPPPPVTPSSPPVSPNETKGLYDLMLTIPPKTLHAYTLAQLRPQPPQPSATTSSPTPALQPNNTPRPLSPDTAVKLTTFFSSLAPPPLLHCMRCHKDFYDIENDEKDKACRVAHDDESALVSRISGGGYETLWGCCGQTAPGDGSEGPPDGWCYEGRHTTDIRRARFRADSTIHNDKLTSCLKLNCRGIRDQFPRPGSYSSPSRNVGISLARRSDPSPVRSQASVLASHSTRKRPRRSLKGASGSENEADAEGSVGRAANKETEGGSAREGDKSMTVDKPDSPSKPKSKAISRPISGAQHPTTASPGTNASPAILSKAKTTAAKPKATSRTLLSRTQTHLASDSDASTHSRPRTRSHVREESRAREGSRSRPSSKLTKADVLERTRHTRKATHPLTQSPASKGAGSNDSESDQEGRGRNRKKRRVGRG